MLRVIAVMAGVASALPAMGGGMTGNEAPNFVAGKLFSYTCFDGTRGLARVHPDGSVDGSIQPKGAGPTHYGTMPAATLRVEGGSVRRYRTRSCSRAFTWSAPMPRASVVRYRD